MTMFRRVFSNHFQGQGKEADPPKPEPTRFDIPPAPPSLPPQLELPTKSPLTELVQRKSTGPLALPIDEAEPPEVDPDVAIRAAEIHDKMLQREALPPTRKPTAPEPIADSEVSVNEIPDRPAIPPRSGRARTRLLGFYGGPDVAADPIAQALTAGKTESSTNPAGWVAITKGPGRGHHFPLFAGVVMVGRGEDQGLRLDFGDQTISRQNHAALAYDPEDNKFYLGHGGKSNIIKLNGRPVLSTEEISHGDIIRIGETTLRFAALCGADFQWGSTNDA
jgi:pSer/pThr/pTyr-binding forkhead associated (FHA) protein